MLAQVVFIQDVLRNGSEGRIQLETAQRHPGAHFQGDAVIKGIHGAAAPGKGGMVELEDRRNMHRVDILITEALDDGVAGVAFVVFGGFLRCQGAAERHRAMKVVGM